jgi:membrane protease YdiL (CAAX protease family)
MAILFFSLLNMSFGIVPDIVYLATVLMIAGGMGKGELSRIFAWRNVPVPLFAGVMVMFFGFEIISSELQNFFKMLLPIPEGFFDGLFYMPDNIFLVILSIALFPGFTEEVFYRGVIARRFFRAYSPRKAVLLSAALFGIAHINPWQMTNAFLYGIFFGWIYWRYRSIWLCMFTHAYHNFLAVFIPRPRVEVGNSGYPYMWRHPLWFDILGLLLFALGLLTVIVLGKKKKKRG